MALSHAPSVVTNGLIWYHDAANGKSFIGGPVTNVLSTTPANIYPSTGNGWGTYNTNQYGSGTFFSIGSISSVSGNVVYTTSNHPLRSYDVMRPQTSGGGVTANTDYLVKKLSNTSFTLHPYNGSQDGSQGYINPATGNHKVYDDFANDVRISVNSSSFPTMWWGSPHLPNSALVKEVITNGFTGLIGRQPTDCLRLHWNRSDASDGMAYNVDASTTANQTYTVSFWLRAASPSAVGKTINYSIYNYGSIAPAGYGFSPVIGALGVWQKYYMTFTPVNPYCISYWFPAYSPMKVDIANIQFELGSVANNVAAYTRTSGQCFANLMYQNGLNISINSNLIGQPSNLIYTSDGGYSFNGTSYLSAFDLSYVVDRINHYTVEIVFKSTAVESYRNIFDAVYGNVNYGPRLEQNSSGNLVWITGNNSGSYSAVTVRSSGLEANVYHHVVLTSSGNQLKSYYNGALVSTVTNPYLQDSDKFYNVNFGRGFSSNQNERWFKGEIPIGRIYNRALSNSEVTQNFNGIRRRFGI